MSDTTASLEFQVHSAQAKANVESLSQALRDNANALASLSGSLGKTQAELDRQTAKIATSASGYTQMAKSIWDANGATKALEVQLNRQRISTTELLVASQQVSASMRSRMVDESAYTKLTQVYNAEFQKRVALEAKAIAASDAFVATLKAETQATALKHAVQLESAALQERIAALQIQQAAYSDKNVQALMREAAALQLVNKEYLDAIHKRGMYAAAPVASPGAAQLIGQASAGSALSTFYSRGARAGEIKSAMAVRDASASALARETAQHIAYQQSMEASVAKVRSLRADKVKLADVTDKATAATKGWTAAQKNAHSAARGLSGALGGLWLTYGNLIPTIGAFTAAMAAVQTVKIGASLEYEMAALKGVSEESTEAIASAKAELTKMADAGSMVGIGDMATGLRTLVQAGFDTKESLSMLRPVMDMVVGGEVAIADAAQVVQKTIHAFQLSAADTPHIVDAIGSVAAKSATDVQSMSAALTSAATVNKLYGASLEETLAMLGVLSAGGIEGSGAGTALTNMLRELEGRTEDARAVFAKLGVDAYTATDALRPPLEVLRDMAKATKDLSPRAFKELMDEAQNIRGMKAMVLILDALRNTNSELDKLYAAAKSSEGFMARLVKGLSETTKGEWKQAVASFGVAFEDAFAGADDEIKSVAVSLKDLARSPEFREFLKDSAKLLAQTAKWLVEHRGLLADISVALASGTLLRMLGGLASSFVSLGTAVLGVNTALKANPLFAAGAVGSLAYQGMSDFLGKYTGQMQGLRDEVKASQELQRTVRTPAGGFGAGDLTLSTSPDFAKEGHAAGAAAFLTMGASHGEKNQLVPGRLAPGTKSLNLPDEGAVKAAARLAEQWEKTKLSLSDETALIGLSDLDKELAQIAFKARDLQAQFGERKEITEYAEVLRGAAIEADNLAMQLHVTGLHEGEMEFDSEALAEMRELYSELSLAVLPEHARAVEEVTRKYADMERQITDLAGAGLLTMDQAQAWVDGLSDNMRSELDGLADKSAETAGELSETWQEAHRNMQSFTKDTFSNIIKGEYDSIGDAFSDMLTDMVANWTAAQFQMAMWGTPTASNPIGDGLISAATSWAGGAMQNARIDSALTEAFEFHSGGVVGIGGRAITAPASLWSGAPRLHNGLAADEFPAILQRGETVTPKNQVGRGGNTGGDVTINLYNQGKQQQVDSSKVKFDVRGMVVDIFLQDMSENGPMRRSMGGGI